MTNSVRALDVKDLEELAAEGARIEARESGSAYPLTHNTGSAIRETAPYKGNEGSIDMAAYLTEYGIPFTVKQHGAITMFMPPRNSLKSSSGY